MGTATLDTSSSSHFIRLHPEKWHQCTLTAKKFASDSPPSYR